MNHISNNHENEKNADQFKPAGSFSNWLRETIHALQGKSEAVVDCGDCTACCTSYYFIHIKPEENKTKAVIPKDILFSAPFLPEGHKILGHDKSGRCPMFKDEKCSIYKDRPRTCRLYDCRIFPATGLDVTADSKSMIAKQSGLWKFDFPTKSDHDEYEALHRAASFLKEYSDHFPEYFIPDNATQLAIVSIEVYKVFLSSDELSIQETVNEIIKIRERK